MIQFLYRAALWQILGKYRVPLALLPIFHSFYEGMKASVCIKGDVSDSFEVCNGVWQGCVITPVHTSVLSLMIGIDNGTC